jgi:hypothetical protein
MHKQRAQDDFPLNLNTMLFKPIQGHQKGNNPMAISALLNSPPDQNLGTYCNSVEEEQHQRLIISLSNNRLQRQVYLSPMVLEPLSPAYSQPLVHHTGPVELSPPQSPTSASYHRKSFSTTFNHGYATPPPSSGQSSPELHSQSNFRTEAPVYYHLAPRPRGNQQQRLRDPHYNTPIQVQSIRVSYSSTHRHHPRLRQSPKKATHRVSKPRKHIGPHSNKPYTVEQVHFLRYHKEDLANVWLAVHSMFYQRFPDSERLSIACLTSRYYRDNRVPKVDANGELVLDKNGNPIMIKAKIRDRATPEGKSIPYLFIEKHPEFALKYDWVRPEDKAVALKILQGLVQPTPEGVMNGKFFR